MRAVAAKRTLASRHQAKTGLSILALALLVLAFTAGPAAAEAPSATIGSASSVSYASAHVTGTVDPADHFIFYTFETSTDGVTWSEFNYEGAAAENTGSQEVSVDLLGLKGGTTYFVRLVASNLSDPEAISAEPNAEFTTLAVAKPTVLAVSLGAVTYTTAAVSGKVERPGNPDPAFDASCRFEYVTEAQFTATGFEGASETLCNPEVVTAPEVETTVTATLTGLARGTTYHLRLTASNAGGGNSLDAASTFTTTTAPQAQTLGAGHVAAGSATLAGRVNPANAPVTYQFQWGASSSYGNAAPASATPMPAADESFDVVTAPLTGLQPATTYHYRIVATNTQTHETAQGQDRTFTTETASGASGSCPNESSRTGFMAGLPDCRAYELATPGLNGASLTEQPNGGARADGSGLWLVSIDAPNNAEGSTVFNKVVAERSSDGWAVYSRSPLLVEPADGFPSDEVVAVSADLSKSLVQVGQRLAGPNSPSGEAFYIREPDGTYTPIQNVGATYSPSGQNYYATHTPYQTPDLSHIYYTGCLGPNQLPSDPLPPGLCPGNTYEWANGTLRLIGILPGPSQTPAPSGADLANGALPPVSDDGEYVLFAVREAAPLYLREHGQQTVEVSRSQRTVNPDPNPPASPSPVGVARDPSPVGVARDGSQVLFTSKAELTDNANTGSSAGTANDRGKDLYSYDVATGVLSDLTVDADPGDASTGANVQRVLGASHDGSYVYFVAMGNLAPGGVSGLENLYVEHEGKTDFVAAAASLSSFYATPDGRHAAFLSQEELTGYDNVNASANSAESEVFEYSYGGGLECASCRGSGAPPLGGASIVGRTVSDDGSRVFFQSTDAVVPQASNGLRNVYEYERGEVHLLSPGDGTSNAVLVDASASGDDVFFATHGELTQDAPGFDAAVYDARVNAVAAAGPPPECTGEGCREAALPSPVFGAPGSTTSSGAGNPPSPAAVVKPKPKTTAAALRAKKLAKALKGCRKDKSKAKRLRCEKQARKRYQTAHKGAK